MTASVAALLLAAFVTPAMAAELYVVHVAATKTCTIVDKIPTFTTTTLMGA